jgi:hypothetical protein
MTVITMPVQPGRGTGTEPGPVPWRGMLWVTWRQHRGLLISVSVTFILGVIAMLIEGPRIHQDYAALTACRPAASPACQQLSNYFNSTDWRQAQGVHIAVLAAPVLLAMFAGPPVLARELENGTFRYTWTQGIGRVRWTAAKLAFIGSVVTIAALVISQLFTWLYSPFLTTQNMTAASPGVFDTRGIVYTAWTLTALCLGAFLGMLIRRVLPAMAATLGGYAALAAATMFYLRSRYPVRTFWPMQVFEGCWLLLLSALLIAGTVWLVRRHAT